MFGIDNTFGSRALDEGILAPYAATLPDGADEYVLGGDDEHALTPVDTGNVCVNVDDTWFAERGDPGADRRSTTSLRPAVPRPASSRPARRRARRGWRSCWPRSRRTARTGRTTGPQLLANGAKVTEGWSDAYEVDFTQGGGGGDRPIVLSYDSSPAFTIGDDGQSTTSALLDTCFRQVEYAGVLAGAANAKGAQALVDFMLGRDFQESLPESMYVFPVDPAAALPEDWAQFAVQPDDPFAVDPAEIAANRDTWLREWSDLVSR